MLLPALDASAYFPPQFDPSPGVGPEPDGAGAGDRASADCPGRLLPAFLGGLLQQCALSELASGLLPDLVRYSRRVCEM